MCAWFSTFFENPFVSRVKRRIAPYDLLRGARELRRAVARSRRRSSRHSARVVLLDHRVVNVDAERMIDRANIPVQAIRCQLHFGCETRGHVLHELVAVMRSTVPDQERDEQLAVGIDCRPRPDVAPSCRLLLWRGTLLLRAAERPNLVALHSLRFRAAHRLIV